jgi:hypothetical protein
MDQSLPLRVVILRLAYEDVDVIFDWLKEDEVRVLRVRGPGQLNVERESFDF